VCKGIANGRQEQTGRQEQLSPAEPPNDGGSALNCLTAFAARPSRVARAQPADHQNHGVPEITDDATDWRQIAAKLNLIPTMQATGGNSPRN
jgi:hypothetical protein